MATKFWGPLGWMTLHSVSAIYPEQPTQEERLLLEKFVELFRECITCVHCKGHFTGMFNRYKQIHPEWSSSRFDFFLFVCRAHNTVNRRLDKPIFPSLESCIDRLKENTKVNSAATYRNAYINYLINNWSREMSSEGYMNADIARRMKKINDEYFTPRDKNFENFSLNREGNVLEFIQEDSKQFHVGNGLPNISRVLNQTQNQQITLPKVGFKFSGGKLKIV
jgi:hypothetical protein